MNKLDKSTRLFALGYRAALRGQNVLVKNPQGTVYAIDPAAGTCTCPYAGQCSHILGYLDLMLDTSNALDVQALEHLECSRFCWSFSPEGLRLAVRAAALSDRAAELRVMVEGRREREMERAA